jgi:predicted RNA-binding protein with PIN domain
VNQGPAEYLIVDGYNVIGAWEDLSALAEHDMGMARDKLRDLLKNHCGYTGQKLLLVFDAHSVTAASERRQLNKLQKGGVVYTAKGETADNYIERFVRENSQHRMTVASSDGLVQVMIFAHASRISSRELEKEVLRVQKLLREREAAQKRKKQAMIEDRLHRDTLRQLDEMRKK